jgi:glycosyl transferase, family 25
MDRMTAQLSGVAFERVPAVDGRNLPVPGCGPEQMAPSSTELTPNEIALTLSHKEAWRRLAASGQEWGCVLEDDATLSPDFSGFMACRDWLPAGASIVKIEKFGRRKLFLGWQKTVFQERSLQPLLSAHLGTAGYAISRGAADLLLSRTLPASRPIDNILFEDLLEDKELKIFQLVPALCIQASEISGEKSLPSELQTTIQSLKKKRLLSAREKALRELKRPFLSLARGAGFVVSGKLAAGNFVKVGYR